MKKLLLSTVFLAGMSLSLHAVPALNRTILKTLPNGNALEIQLNGDENFHYTTLPDGTLITEADNGYFYYATGEFYQFNLSSCIRQQNSLTAQFVSFSLSNLANIFYPPQFLQ